MTFVSIGFIVFMAFVALLYFLVPKKQQWVVLLCASYVFFFINSQWLIVVLFAQTLSTFLIARRIDFYKKTISSALTLETETIKHRCKQMARLGVALNLLALLLLKYFNFFIGTGNVFLAMVGVTIPPLPLVVPIGMSFYTLQAVAYVVDVNRGKTEADKSLLRFMLFMSYFPQILQGPIPRYGQLAKQLYGGHRFSYASLRNGSQLILWGFFKKLVIADRLAIPVNQLFDNYYYYDGPILFFAAVGYGIQVYADFSGGVDIARGFSQVLGIDLVDNFRQPYYSRSIEEFWQRWHITLGSWMRDYVFYPLSLSKAFGRLGKKSRKIFGASIGKRIPPFVAMFVVFFCVGFWHGANWTYILYGVWNGIFISLNVLFNRTLYKSMRERAHVNESAGSWRIFQLVRTVVICSIGRYFSRATSVAQSFGMIGNTLTGGLFNLSFLVDGTMLNLGLDYLNWGLLFVVIVILFLVDAGHERGIAIRERLSRQNVVFRWLVYTMAFIAVLLFGVYGGDNGSASFIYQQF